MWLHFSSIGGQCSTDITLVYKVIAYQPYHCCHHLNASFLGMPRAWMLFIELIIKIRAMFFVVIQNSRLEN